MADSGCALCVCGKPGDLGQVGRLDQPGVQGLWAVPVSVKGHQEGPLPQYLPNVFISHASSDIITPCVVLTIISSGV